jgi:hypothetical protein
VDILLTIIIVLGGLLLITTAYMEWIGLLNIVTPRGQSRYRECGHLRINPVAAHGRCWRCRHHTLDHLLPPPHH